MYSKVADIYDKNSILPALDAPASGVGMGLICKKGLGETQLHWGALWRGLNRNVEVQLIAVAGAKFCQVIDGIAFGDQFEF